jgi:hypothetical protein
VAADLPPYCGVRGRALAEIDEERGLEILRRLLIRYTGGDDNPLSHKLLSRSEPEVALRLKPQGLVTWNFTKRMKGSTEGVGNKTCPDQTAGDQLPTGTA